MCDDGYECGKCGKKFKDVTHLHDHMYSNNACEKYSKKTIECEGCGNKYTTEKAKKHHQYTSCINKKERIDIQKILALQNEKINKLQEIIEANNKAKRNSVRPNRIEFETSTKILGNDNTTTVTTTNIGKQEITNEYKKKKIPRAVKTKVWKMQNGNTLEGKCYACDRVIDYDNFEAGHVIAEADGGETIVENLKAVCKPCNTSCGTKNLEIFKQMLKTKQMELL
jgi:hypothetical protein